MVNNGISPPCWGPALWHSLHAISFGYPEKVGDSPEEHKLKQDTYRFFEYLGAVLPCPECKEHYSRNFYDHNLMVSLNSRKDFTKWVYDLHNRVNKETKVPESEWPSYKDVYNKFNNIRSENCEAMPGVCGSGSTDIYCKVELLSRSEDQKKEMFGLSYGNQETLIAAIVLGILLLVAIGYGLYCTNSKKQQKYKKMSRKKR
jgi:hypothetical protein